MFPEIIPELSFPDLTGFEKNEVPVLDESLFDGFRVHGGGGREAIPYTVFMDVKKDAPQVEETVLWVFHIQSCEPVKGFLGLILFLVFAGFIEEKIPFFVGDIGLGVGSSRECEKEVGEAVCEGWD